MSWHSLALLGLNFRFIGPCEVTLLALNLPNVRATLVDITDSKHKHIQSYKRRGARLGFCRYDNPALIEFRRLRPHGASTRTSGTIHDFNSW